MIDGDSCLLIPNRLNPSFFFLVPRKIPLHSGWFCLRRIDGRGEGDALVPFGCLLLRTGGGRDGDWFPCGGRVGAASPQACQTSFSLLPHFSFLVPESCPLRFRAVGSSRARVLRLKND